MLPCVLNMCTFNVNNGRKGAVMIYDFTTATAMALNYRVALGTGAGCTGCFEIKWNVVWFRNWPTFLRKYLNNFS